MCDNMRLMSQMINESHYRFFVLSILHAALFIFTTCRYYVQRISAECSIDPWPVRSYINVEILRNIEIYYFTAAEEQAFT